jgi:hypothetical protein
MIWSKIQHRRSYRFLGKLDATGKANATLYRPENTGEAPGMLKASFITKVYEEGGDFSTDVMTTYSPYPTYVGIKAPEPNKYGMLETRTMNQFDVVTVDETEDQSRLKTWKCIKLNGAGGGMSSDNLSNYNDNATTSYKLYNQC